MEYVNWTEILLAIIAMLSGLLMKTLVPYINSLTVENRRLDLDYWVKAAVIYVEKNHDEEQSGAIKKEDVTRMIMNMGLKVEPEQLIILIDAVVEIVINQKEELDCYDGDILSKEL